MVDVISKKFNISAITSIHIANPLLGRWPWWRQQRTRHKRKKTILACGRNSVAATWCPHSWHTRFHVIYVGFWGFLGRLQPIDKQKTTTSSRVHLHLTTHIIYGFEQKTFQQKQEKGNKHTLTKQTFKPTSKKANSDDSQLAKCFN